MHKLVEVGGDFNDFPQAFITDWEQLREMDPDAWMAFSRPWNGLFNGFPWIALTSKDPNVPNAFSRCRAGILFQLFASLKKDIQWWSFFSEAKKIWTIINQFRAGNLRLFSVGHLKSFRTQVPKQCVWWKKINLNLSLKLIASLNFILGLLSAKSLSDAPFCASGCQNSWGEKAKKRRRFPALQITQS